MILPAAVQPQGQLQHEQLLIDKPPLGRLKGLATRRPMQRPDCGSDRQQILGCQHLLRQRLFQTVGRQIKCRLHRHPHVRLLHALGQRIDGQPFDRAGVFFVIKPADLRMRKLPNGAISAGLPRDHQAAAHTSPSPFCSTYSATP